MMLVARLNYRTKDFKGMTAEQQAVMLKHWMPARILYEQRQKSYPDDPAKWLEIATWNINNRQRLTLEEAQALEIAGIKLELAGVDGTMLTKMEHRADKYGDITPMELATGQIVQIAVPDLGLLQINEVDWLANACTQELQDRLTDGWRILAVCPPNAQRRPDYILGRSKS